MAEQIHLRDQRNPGKAWFWMDAEAVSHFAPRVGPFGMAVYTFMAASVFKDASLNFSLQQIADATGMSKAQAGRAVQIIVEIGMMVITDKGSRTKAPKYALIDLKELNLNMLPASLVETPASLVETPASLVETPASLVETPASLVETPASLVETLNKELKKKKKITTPTPTAPDAVKATPESKPLVRFHLVRSAVQDHQRSRLGGVTIWPPQADKALASLMNTYGEHEWPAYRLVECVVARFASEEDPARPPQEWIGTLPRYISGPKDRFKQLAPVTKNPNHSPPTDFGKIVAMEFETSKNIKPSTPQVRDAFFDLMRHEVSPLVFSTWVRPLYIATSKRSNTTLILAPSKDWQGMQEKYTEKIKSVLRQCGLTGEYDLWYMNKSGKWSGKESSAAA